MAETVEQRALEHVVRLAAAPLSLVALWEQVSEVLTTVVPCFDFPCWFTVDPASLLITSHWNPSMPELPPEALALEYYGDDVNQIADVARSAAGMSTLHEAYGGDPSGSPRWQANIQYGGDQELIAALRAPSGTVWGAVGLYREPGEPMFDARDKQWLAAAVPHLAEGARRALLMGEATDPEGPQAPGLIVLDEGFRVQSATPGVQAWLADLPDGDEKRLPAAVQAVAGRALHHAVHGQRPGEVAMARVRGRSGTWIVLHGAVLDDRPERRVAVIVEPAHPARISSLLMAAYGLTERERDVTRLVLQGSSTEQVAQALVVSPHTVQQHLKSIFDKTGVRSRRDLVAKLFFSHYEPRLRDNEARAQRQQPLRGGPLAPV